MPRYKLTIEYDGTGFAGWQTQAGLPTVQRVLADAVEKLAGERVHVAGAGRTDAGVHATGQVAHVDLTRDWRTDTVRDGLTAHLRPHPVAVLSAERVDAEFEARFSAVRRHYLYRIVKPSPGSGAGAGPGLAGAAAARCGRHARGGAAAAGQA